MMKNRFIVGIMTLLSYSWVYYILVMIVLMTCVDWLGAQNDHYSCVANRAFMQELKNPRENILYADQWLSLDPHNLSAWRLLGISYYNLRDYKRAEMCFMRAFELSKGASNDAQFMKFAQVAFKGGPVESLSVSYSRGP